MWFLKDIVLVVGCVVMTTLTIAGFIGVGLDVREIHSEISRWPLTWFELGFIIIGISFISVVVRLIYRLNKYERTKPILKNRQGLFTAIHNLQEGARDVIFKNDVWNSKRFNALPDAKEAKEYATASGVYWETEKKLDTEAAIAGLSFAGILTLFKNTVKLQVMTRDVPNPPSYPEMIELLGEIVSNTEREIDAISQ